jgi:hypothetical protein
MVPTESVRTETVDTHLTQDSVEVLDCREINLDLAFSGSQGDLYAGVEAITQPTGNLVQVPTASTCLRLRGPLGSIRTPLDDGLGGTNREVLVHDLVSEALDGRVVGKAEERTSMARAENARRYPLLHRNR